MKVDRIWGPEGTDNTGQRSYKDWECAVDRLSQILCLLDREQRVLRVNRVIESWGLSDVRQANGLSLHALLHPDCQDPQCALVTWLNWAWQQLEVQEIVASDLWDSVLGRYLSIRIIRVTEQSTESCDTGSTRAALVTIEDVGNYKKAETALHNLSVKLINAQENERKRIALELHDGISQSLSAIKFNLEAEISRINQQPREAHQQELQNLVQKMRDAMEELRRISMDLWPSMLDDLGIIATMNWFIRECKKSAPGIQWVVDIQLEEADVEEQLKITLFRILQEASNNACKHANASEVKIELSKKQNTVNLQIQDNGEGFDVGATHTQDGIGLRSMQERVSLTDGVINIKSSAAGTCINVSWLQK